MTQSLSKKWRTAFRIGRALATTMIGVVCLVWMLWASLPMTPVVRAGDATVDAAAFIIQQATARAQETQSARATEVAGQRASATAARQATLDKISVDAAYAQQTITKQSADAQLTQQAVQVEQTRAAATMVAATNEARAEQTRTAEVRTRAADNAHGTQTRQANDATATAVVRQQEQADREANIKSAGMVLGLVGIVIVGGLLVIGLVVWIVRGTRRKPTVRAEFVEPGEPMAQPEMPQVVFVPMAPVTVIDDPEQAAQMADHITRLLEQERRRQGKWEDADGHADIVTIDVSPTE